MWLWFFRIIGVVMVISGLKGIFDFVVTILKVVPFVANIVGWGVGVVCTVIGVAWSLIIIAIAWLFYRPVLAISLLGMAVLSSVAGYLTPGTGRLPGMGVRFQGQGQTEEPGLEIQSAQG